MNSGRKQIRKALVIACSKYDDPSLSQLRAPAQDATSLTRVLNDSKVGEYSVKQLLDSSAQAVREAIDGFFSDCQRDDHLLLYISCHGVKRPGGQLHFATRDTRLKRLASTAISSEWVLERIEESGSKRVVVLLDCCYSGTFARGFKAKAPIEVDVIGSMQGYGRIVVTASREMEYAFEEEELTSGEGKRSIFTGVVVEGLESGDADLDGDGEIIVEDLFEYVRSQVVERTSYQQPTMSAVGVSGPIIIAHSRRGRRVFSVSNARLLDINPTLALTSNELTYLRRHLHVHPELAFQERETTALLARRLEAEGLRIRLLPRGTGLLCDVGTNDGPIVALRAELDAVRMNDLKDVPYRSTVSGVCHACGHDLHMVILLGVGLALSEKAEALAGRVRLVFQPASEVSSETTTSGALSVIESQALEGVAAVFALHCDPSLEVGRVGLRPGPVRPSLDWFEIEVEGPAPHPGSARITPNSVYSAARLANDLPGVVSHLTHPQARIYMRIDTVEGKWDGYAESVKGRVAGVIGTWDSACHAELPKWLEAALESGLRRSRGCVMVRC